MFSENKNSQPTPEDLILDSVATIERLLSWSGLPLSQPTHEIGLHSATEHPTNPDALMGAIMVSGPDVTAKTEYDVLLYSDAYAASHDRLKAVFTMTNNGQDWSPTFLVNIDGAMDRTLPHTAESREARRVPTEEMSPEEVALFALQLINAEPIVGNK